jgi:predicted GTPase
MREIEKIRSRQSQEIDCAELTEMLHEQLRRKPLFHKRQRLQLFSITRRQERGLAFTLCVNHTEWFGSSQLAFFERIIRKKYDLRGCPIKFMVVRRGRTG